MDYEQFLQSVIEELKDNFPGAEMEISHISKIQDESYTGLSIKPENQAAGVTMNLYKMYSDLEFGTPFEEIINKIRDVAMQALNEIPDMDLSALTDYEKMKPNLIMCAIPTDRNREMLERIPHREIEDLSIIYRFQLGNAHFKDTTVLVTNELLQTFGISAEQLMADAAAVVPERKPVLFRPLEEVLADMMSFGGVEPVERNEPQPLLASVQDMINGAGILGYPDFFRQAAEVVGGSFYILPSSIHELLLLPEEIGMSVREMNEMVSSVNAMTVLPEEQLSDEAYHYDVRTQQFEKASDYEFRIIESQTKAFDVVADKMAVYLKEPVQQTEIPDKSVPEPEMMNVLLVKPSQYPEEVRIGTDLGSLQAAVGGNIEAVFPFEDRVCLIANEEGKLEGLPLNRGLRDEKGEIYDVIAGPFLVAGLTDGDFGSLTPAQMVKFKELFHQPEMFIKMGKGIMSLPLPEEMGEKAEKRAGKHAEKAAGADDKARLRDKHAIKQRKTPVHDDR